MSKAELIERLEGLYDVWIEEYYGADYAHELLWVINMAKTDEQNPAS